MSIMPKYIVSKTLLASTPDINKRIIRRTSDMEEICILNPHMKEWTSGDEVMMQNILDALNAEDDQRYKATSTTSELPSHPDCPRCNANREKTRDRMRKRRAKS